jgi:hypothetical protein
MARFHSDRAANQMTAQLGWFVQGKQRTNATLIFIDKDDEPNSEGFYDFKERSARTATPQEFDIWQVVISQAAELWRRSGVQDNGGGLGMKAEDARDSLGNPKDGGHGARA